MRHLVVRLKCPKCGHVFDVPKKDYDDGKIVCPKCGVKA